MPTLPNFDAHFAEKNRQNVPCFRQSGIRQNGIRQKRHIPTTLRLEPRAGMVGYLTRAEYVNKQLELAGEKVSKNMLTSIVLKGLPQEYE